MQYGSSLDCPQPAASSMDEIPKLILKLPQSFPLTRMWIVKGARGELASSMWMNKVGLDHEVLKNYRSVSNLPFLSKTFERVATERLRDYVTQNYLTILIRVQNEKLITLDMRGVAVFILLDLSATFDTIDYSLLLVTMRHLLGPRGFSYIPLSAYT